MKIKKLDRKKESDPSEKKLFRKSASNNHEVLQ